MLLLNSPSPERLVLADAVDRAAGYRQIFGRDAGITALGGQAAAAGDGQIPVHTDTGVSAAVLGRQSTKP